MDGFGIIRSSLEVKTLPSVKVGGDVRNRQLNIPPPYSLFFNSFFSLPSLFGHIWLLFFGCFSLLPYIFGHFSLPLYHLSLPIVYLVVSLSSLNDSPPLCFTSSRNAPSEPITFPMLFKSNSVFFPFYTEWEIG